MANLFILCGPPGSGKTTLLRMIRDRGVPLLQLRRITTRQRRPEEGDKGAFSLEYEFLEYEEFASRLSRVSSANFIEWNGNLYATDFNDIQVALRSGCDALLYEDMPSAIHLHHLIGREVKIILLFTEDREDLLKLEFARLSVSKRPSLVEWRRRLGLKYMEAAGREDSIPLEEAKEKYIEQKMRRAGVDLAFMARKIQDERVNPDNSL